MTIIIPTLGLDLSLLDRLNASIDFPVVGMVLCNGQREQVSQWLNARPQWWFHNVAHHRGNLGVAATWNLAPNLWKQDKAWIICNDDVQFEPGALGEFCRKIEELADKESFIMFNEAEGFCCFAWTRVGVQRFGLFDENFFPAYEEDWDMKMRWSVEGYRPPNVFGKELPLKHGKPSGGPRYNKMIQDGAALRKDYFIRKWGRLDYKDPPFKTPFNDPNKSVKDWTIEPELRQRLQKTWDDFISQPNPSIYT